MVIHHDEPNVYYIHLWNLDKKVHLRVMNWCQLFYLNQSTPPSIASSSATGDLVSVPSFLHSNRSSNFNSQSNIDLNFSVNSEGTNATQLHHYNTRHKHKTTAASRQVVAETIITYL